MKRQSDTPVTVMPSLDFTSSLSLNDDAPNQPKGNDGQNNYSIFNKSKETKETKAPKRRLKVKIKKWHGVARWTWNAGDGEVCGICQSSFEGVAPGVKYPGDECPVVWGKCGHSFHLQCVSTWLGSRSTCPICRRDWEFSAERETEDDNNEDED
mmetsp:Transcript_37139/g.54622  ORF Transcript_37139/g.54622 Transcript_37139/m.54622 type:complete len:154 (-) Transcript_37139:469-930(-)